MDYYEFWLVCVHLFDWLGGVGIGSSSCSMYVPEQEVSGDLGVARPRCDGVGRVLYVIGWRDVVGCMFCVVVAGRDTAQCDSVGA